MRMEIVIKKKYFVYYQDDSEKLLKIRYITFQSDWKHKQWDKIYTKTNINCKKGLLSFYQKVGEINKIEC